MRAPDSGLLYAAYRDATCADKLIESGIDDFTEAIAFHCQQSIEKQLKAVLVENGIIPPKTHDLTDLLQVISDKADIDMTPTLITSAARLTRHAVATRYSLSFEVDRGAALQAINDANTISSFITENGYSGIEIASNLHIPPFNVDALATEKTVEANLLRRVNTSQHSDKER